MKWYFIALCSFIFTVATTDLITFALIKSEAKIFEPIKPWQPNQVWLPSGNFNDRAFLRTLITKLDTPDVLILGTSKVRTITTSMFPAGTKVFNAFLNGATLYDMLAIWQIFQDQSKIPKRVILFLEPWMLNKNELEIRFAPNFDAYFHFLDRNLKASGDPFTSLKYMINKVNIAKRFFPLNPYDVIVGYHGTSKVKWRMIPESQLPLNPQGRRFDGSTYSPSSLEPSGFQRWVDNPHLLANWQLNDDAILSLTLLEKDLRSHGSSLYLGVPPVMPELFKRFFIPNQYKAILNEFNAALQGQRNLCNALDPSRPKCDKEDFSDSIHPNSNCMMKLLKYCNPIWQEQITQQQGP